MSEYIRRTRKPLKRFTELVRCLSHTHYRPNKALQPEILRAYCQGYEHVGDLVRIASDGSRVRLTSPIPQQHLFPRNHPSVSQRIQVL